MRRGYGRPTHPFPSKGPWNSCDAPNLRFGSRPPPTTGYSGYPSHNGPYQGYTPAYNGYTPRHYQHYGQREPWRPGVPASFGQGGPPPYGNGQSKTFHPNKWKNRKDEGKKTRFQIQNLEGADDSKKDADDSTAGESAQDQTDPSAGDSETYHDPNWYDDQYGAYPDEEYGYYDTGDYWGYEEPYESPNPEDNFLE